MCAPQTGHALRAVDAAGLLRTDTFLLVDGPTVISNARLNVALERHAERNAADAEAIFTVLLTPDGTPATVPAALGGVTSGSALAASAMPAGGLSHQLRVSVDPDSTRLRSYVSRLPAGLMCGNDLNSPNSHDAATAARRTWCRPSAPPSSFRRQLLPERQLWLRPRPRSPP